MLTGVAALPTDVLALVGSFLVVRERVVLAEAYVGRGIDILATAPRPLSAWQRSPGFIGHKHLMMRWAPRYYSGRLYWIPRGRRMSWGPTPPQDATYFRFWGPGRGAYDPTRRAGPVIRHAGQYTLVYYPYQHSLAVETLAVTTKTKQQNFVRAPDGCWTRVSAVDFDNVLW